MPPAATPGRSPPTPGRLGAAVLHLAFCLLAGLLLAGGLRVWIEDLDYDPPDFVLFLLPIGCGIGGAYALTAWHGRLWDRGRRWPAVGLLVVEAACLYPGFAVLAAVRPDRGEEEAAFAAHAAGYLALTPGAEQFGPGRLRGHCVIVGDSAGAIQYETFAMGELPRPIRARTPAEVASVVQLRWGRRPLASPDGAWVQTCAITVLDAETRQVLARTFLEGKWREVRPKGGTPFWTGGLEWGAVPDYLKALPREP